MHMDKKSSKVKVSCRVCRLCRMADDFRRHPSGSTLHQMQVALDSLRAYEHMDALCADHAPPRRRIDATHMVCHRVNHAAADRSMSYRLM